MAIGNHSLLHYDAVEKSQSESKKFHTIDIRLYSLLYVRSPDHGAVPDTELNSAETDYITASFKFLCTYWTKEKYTDCTPVMFEYRWP